MALIDRLPAFARLEFLGKHQAHGRQVVAGFLAGLVLFLGWWVFQPPIGVRQGVGATATADAATQRASSDRNGVLDGITGAPEPMRGDVRDGQDSDAGASSFSDVDAQATAEGVAPDDAAVAAFPPEDGVPPPPPEDAGDSATPMPMPATPETATLRPWYVEVEREPGVSEQLRIDATTPEQARAILRDYRGDPRVIRGPSPQPLD